MPVDTRRVFGASSQDLWNRQAPQVVEFRDDGRFGGACVPDWLDMDPVFVCTMDLRD